MSSSGQSVAQESDTSDSSNAKEELFGIGEIPDDWDKEPLSDRAEIIAGSSPPGSTYNDVGDGLPFFQGNADFGALHPVEVKWCSEPQKVAEPRDILISIRAPVGDLNIADQKCCIGRGLAALRPNELNGLYLYYSLRKRQRWLSRLATGSTFKAITKGDLERLDVALPPLEEQRKVASVLYNLDECIQKTESVISQVTRVRAGLLQDLLQRGVTRNGALRPAPESSPTEYREAKGRVIPNDWSIRNLADVGEWISGKTPKRSENSLWGGDIPWITAKDMKKLRVTKTEDQITQNAVDSGASMAPPSSVLVLVRGMILDHTFPVVRPTRETSFNQDVKAIIPEDGIDPDFLAYWLKSRSHEVLALVTAASHGTKRLATEALGKVTIPLPPIEEQNSIVEIVRSQEERITQEKAFLGELRRLKSGLMQDLLSGEVRTHDKDIDVLPEVKQHG